METIQDVVCFGSLLIIFCALVGIVLGRFFAYLRIETGEGETYQKLSEDGKTKTVVVYNRHRSWWRLAYSWINPRVKQYELQNDSWVLVSDTENVYHYPPFFMTGVDPLIEKVDHLA